jgi:hypothetical protein
VIGGVAALSASKHPALVVGPGIDRAQAVDLTMRKRLPHQLLVDQEKRPNLPNTTFMQ